MFGTFGQYECANSVVFHASTVTLTAAACDQLEKAGIPARMGKLNDSLVVVVPQTYISESHQLLNGHPHHGEIYF